MATKDEFLPTRATAMTSKNFEELTVEEVGAWLVSVRLNNAFAEGFAEQQLDGSCLMDAEEDDFDRSGEPILVIQYARTQPDANVYSVYRFFEGS